MVAVAFNDDGWDKVTRSYTKSAARIAQSIHQFKKIEKATKEYARGNTRVMESLTTVGLNDNMDDDDDDRANLADDDSIGEGDNSQ